MRVRDFDSSIAQTLPQSAGRKEADAFQEALQSASQTPDAKKLKAKAQDLNDKLTGKAAEADKVAREFETLFMDLVMKSMRQTARPEEQSNATEIYQGMLDAEQTKNMTNAQDFGIRSLILDWMKNVDPDINKQLGKEGQASLSKIQNDGNQMKNALTNYKLMSAPR